MFEGEILGLKKTGEEEELSFDEGVSELEKSRAELIGDILTSRATDFWGNLTPGLNIVKKTVELAIGRTSSNRELDTKHRLLYAVESAAMLYACYVLAKEYNGTATPEMLYSAIIGKVGANAKLTKDVTLQLFQSAKGVVTDKEFMSAVFAAIATLPSDLFDYEIVELDLKNA